MRKYCEGHARVSSAATKALGERAVIFLRRKHPIKTAESVSADTGLPVSTVAKWLERAASPGGFAVVQLACAYGPEFLCAVMASPPKWLDEAARAEEQRRLRAEIAALQAKLERT